MLRLDKHLQYQMNHFHGGYFDFIYKINEVLEYNNIKENFYNDAVKVIKNEKVKSFRMQEEFGPKKRIKP